MQSQAPGVNTRTFRNALGQFATGVTVVTCLDQDGAPIGITANSFASVSLDPPLVLWSPAKTSTRYGPFMAARHFAIHVMGADQAAICSGFARDGRAFETCDWTSNTHGVPILSGCLARFECSQNACHDAGDHTIIVGLVESFAAQDGTPLVFSSGGYGSFVPAG